MLDFPSPATVGQTYPSPPQVGVPVYTWDGEKWNTGTSGISSVYVAKAGDTMSGSLAISSPTPALSLNKTGVSQDAAIHASYNGIARWDLSLADSTAEAGSNTGSNFTLYRRNDSGVFVDTPLVIARSTGDVILGGNVKVASTSLSLNSDNTKVLGNAGQSTFYVNGPNSYMNYVKATGNWTWVTNNSTQMEIQTPVAMNFYGAAYKPGGGAWGDNSDVRIKNVTGEFKAGLEEISKLRPVTFTFKGNDTSQPPDYVRTPEDSEQAKLSKEPPVTVPYPNSMHYQAAISRKRFHGFVAQEVEAVFPEMVTKRRGYIDGVEVSDMRDLDTTPLIIALVNCIKELKARVEALEAA